MATPRTGKPAGRSRKPVYGPQSVVAQNFGALPPPADFGTYEEKLWVGIWSAGQGHLSPTQDRLLVERVCRKLGLIRQLEEWLSGDVTRRWYTTNNGQTVSHPAVKQIEQADAQATAWLSMLGFSASDRARLGIAVTNAANPLKVLHDTIAERREAGRRNAEQDNAS